MPDIARWFAIVGDLSQFKDTPTVRIMLLQVMSWISEDDEMLQLLAAFPDELRTWTEENAAGRELMQSHRQALTDWLAAC